VETGRVSLGRRDDIQGLRAIAVGLVVAAHLATYQVTGASALQGGFIGVDVFFVLSGYLITSLLVREADGTGTVSLVGFYARRARRILPAATVVLVAVVLYAGFRLPHSQLTRIVPDAWWSALFLANWHFGHTGTSYFDPTFLSPLQHFWSLAVEEQFYLVWPLLMLLLAPRLPRRVLAGLVGLVIVASLAWSVHVTHADPAAAYFSTPARVYELALGALLALGGLPRLSGRLRLGLGVLGLAGLGVATVLLGTDAPFPGWEALVPTTATALLLVAGEGSPTPVTRLLSLRPLRHLGDLSYSLYLWHFPVIVLAGSFLPAHWRTRETVPVEVVLMLALAALSYHLVEQPFRQRRIPALRTHRRTLVLWPTALALVLAGTLGARAWSSHEIGTQQEAAAAWWQSHGEAAPVTAPLSFAALPDLAAVGAELHRAVVLDHDGAPVPPAFQPADEAADTWGRAYPCDAGYGATTAPDCAYGDTTATRVVAAVGDSHMGMWLPALDTLGRQEHFRVVPLIKVGCAAYAVYQPSLQMPQQECDDFRTWTRARLVALRPDVIVTTARGELFMHPRGGQTVAQQWTDGVRTTLTMMRSVTPRVVVLGDVPNRGAEPEDCLTRPGATLLDCEVGPTGPSSRSNPLTEAVAEQLGLGWVSVQPLACDGAVCPLVVDDDRIYQDDSHLAVSWVRYVTRAFGALVDPLIEDGHAGRGTTATAR
jgi:peptidoglycan/LPS O-acetylase OafA/YrhL